ncbi:SusC/RagA family TonB-linked outer membrane protein [Salinibacter altiplanensis]|uniref:SusC/RagA family TonB-linked outer membrane protein n=1 Tax=Salinibacter altiplanensis TaxID=1803181 RepID=UPI000C9F3991|nr:SusC/RagA family TonB-linked outer membrane protein [Salinibacter altiplanensis]
MKRLIPSIAFGVLLLLLPGLTWAQQGTVTGTVTEAESGSPLPGATVQIVDEGTGAATDSDGRYRITGVPAGERTLQVSFVGYQEQERSVNIPAGGTARVNFQLRTSQAELDEVVVTALGIEQEERSLGYASSEVDGAEIEGAGEANLTNALSGKTAGLDISQSSGQPGSGTRITLRGNNSYQAGGNQPLIILDGVRISNASDDNPTGPGVFTGGTANRLADLDPNSIKSVNVLKGASAAALYGQQASNGAIIIETKDGSGTDGIEASYTVSAGYDDAIIDGFQDEYLQGTQGCYQNGVRNGREGAYSELGDPNSGECFDVGGPDQSSNTQTAQSWGPHKDSLSTAVLDSIGQPNTVDPREQFFEDGTQLENSLTVSGQGDFGTASVTVTDTRNDGIVPSTKFNKTSISANYSADLSEKFSADVSAQYTETRRDFMLEANGPNSYQWALQSAPINFDLEPARFEDGTNRSFSGGSRDNPLFTTDALNLASDVDRFIGAATFTYQPIEWLTLKERIGVDRYDDNRKEKINAGTSAEPNGSTFDQTIRRRQIDSDFTVTADRQVTDDLNVNFLVGNNIRKRTFNSLEVIGTDINVRDFFNISNFNTLDRGQFQNEEVLIGAYGDLSLNYNDYAYLSITGRNDWSSTLPEENRSFFYPSANLSFIFTEALSGAFEEVPISFGRVRLSASQVGNDTDPFQLRTTFGQSGSGDGVRGNITFPFNGVNAFQQEDTRANPNLEPASTTEYEAGLDLRFFGGRANISTTYYNKSTTDQIFDVPASDATGFPSQSRNAGEIVNRGWEIEADGTALQIGDFSWDIGANWTKNTTEIKELAPGVSNIFLFGFTTIQIRAETGEDGYGIIFARGFRRNGDISPDNPLPLPGGSQRTEPYEGFGDDAKLIGPDGQGLLSAGPKNIGNVQPDWQGGFNTSISWKGLSVSTQWEYSQGGEILNFDRFYMEGNGTHEATANRGEEITRDGIQIATGESNETSVVRDQEFFTGPANSNFERFVEDASYLKLRQASISYQFQIPQRIGRISGLETVRVGATGRNLITFSDFSMGDPAGSLAGTGNGQGFYHGVTPSTRTYRFSVRLGF